MKQVKESNTSKIYWLPTKILRHNIDYHLCSMNKEIANNIFLTILKILNSIKIGMVNARSSPIISKFVDDKYFSFVLEVDISISIGAKISALDRQ